jgi:hypothetical protein
MYKLLHANTAAWLSPEVPANKTLAQSSSARCSIALVHHHLYEHKVVAQLLGCVDSRACLRLSGDLAAAAADNMM